MALVGDSYGYTRKKQGIDGKDQTDFIKFVTTTPDAKPSDILQVLAKGGKVKTYIYKDNKDGDIYLIPQFQIWQKQKSFLIELIPYIQKKINDMVAKIKEQD